MAAGEHQNQEPLAPFGDPSPRLLPPRTPFPMQSPLGAGAESGSTRGFEKTALKPGNPGAPNPAEPKHPPDPRSPVAQCGGCRTGLRPLGLVVTFAEGRRPFPAGGREPTSRGLLRALARGAAVAQPRLHLPELAVWLVSSGPDALPSGCKWTLCGSDSTSRKVGCA